MNWRKQSPISAPMRLSVSDYVIEVCCMRVMRLIWSSLILRQSVKQVIITMVDSSQKGCAMS